MKKEDFKLARVDKGDNYEDYFYDTSEEANNYLQTKHLTQGLKGVSKVIYAKLDDVVALKRDFDNDTYNVVVIDDPELYSILRELTEEIKKTDRGSLVADSTCQ